MYSRKWLLGIVSLVSVCTGFAYMLQIGFDVQSFGIPLKPEREIINFWAVHSIGLGLIVFVMMLLRSKMNRKVNDGLLITFVSLLFLIQLPPILLWFVVLITGNLQAAMGVATHTIILIFIVRILTMGRRDEAGAV